MQRNRKMARPYLRRAVCSLLCLVSFFFGPITAAAQSGVFSTTGSMTIPRVLHIATLMPNGKVLIAGGWSCLGCFEARAELYDASTGTFGPTGSMSNARTGPTGTLLPNGKVLIVGGLGPVGDLLLSLASAELYDPATGTFSATGSMITGRSDHTATLLPNGKVLIAGGFGDTGGLASAELYDPATGTFGPTGSMSIARDKPIATLLFNGKVLIAGGSSNGFLATAELYDPVTGTFGPTGSMTNARGGHTANLLPNGKVLIAGGCCTFADFLATAELYDASTGTFGPTGSMSNARTGHTGTLLSNGAVLIAGGCCAGVQSADLYDQATGAFNATASMSTVRYNHTATLLPDGTVLVAGGFNQFTLVASAELYGFPLSVTIEIKPPAVPPVPINLSSGGVVSVAILSSSTFDARTVSPTTVTLAGAAVAHKGKGTPQASIQDVNHDGLPDLVVQISTTALQLSNTAVQAVLTGQTYSGRFILGTEAVVIVP